MESKLEELINALQDRDCRVEQHASIMEVTFASSTDADWFEAIMRSGRESSGASCLMSLRPEGENKTHKFVFNVQDMDRFIALIKSDKSLK